MILVCYSFQLAVGIICFCRSLLSLARTVGFGIVVEKCGVKAICAAGCASDSGGLFGYISSDLIVAVITSQAVGSNCYNAQIDGDWRKLRVSFLMYARRGNVRAVAG